MKTTGVAIVAIMVAMLAGCTDDEAKGDAAACQDPDPVPVGDHPVATIKTNLGTVEADLFAEMAPRTVANFVCLAQAGFYDGIHFHRIISNFMMQGGDPNTLDDDPGNDGQGGPGYDIPDEFHHELRHDVGGLLSMANAGRGTGGSQFFVTFGPTGHLDDRHTIFGKVRSMEVVQKVNAEAGSSNGAPRKQVLMEDVSIRFENVQVENPASLRVTTPDDTHAVPAGGGATQFIVVVENLGDLRATVELSTSGDAQASIEQAFRTIELPARQRAAVVVDATVGAVDVTTFEVTASSHDANASVTLSVRGSQDVGPAVVQRGDKVMANYIGMTPDGRFFDTSLLRVANAAEQEDRWFDLFGKRGDATYKPFEFTPGGNVIDGFTDLAVGTPEGGTAAGRMPPAKAYGSGGCQPTTPCLAGMTLIFQLQIIDIVE